MALSIVASMEATLCVTAETTERRGEKKSIALFFLFRGY
jgi:hypothetical protein